MGSTHYKLLEAWLKHCEEAKHPARLSQADQVCSFMSEEYAVCCQTSGCDWIYRSRPDYVPDIRNERKGANMEPRYYKLLEAWIRHCEETKHVPKSHGGNATYNLVPAAYAIYCCARCCEWVYRIKPDVDK